MIKSKLLQAVVLGLCISALSSGVAFASTGEGSAPSDPGVQLTEEENLLYAKQKEIDQYLFTDHTKEIEAKGFEINYTGITDTSVEIGITPYTEENANYLYGIFGKDIVKVVKSDEAMLYTTTTAEVAPDAVVSSEAVDPSVKDEIYTTTVVDAAANTGVVGPMDDGKVYKDDQEMSIQIETINPEASKNDPDVIYQTLGAPEVQSDSIKTVSAAENSINMVDTSAKSDSNGLSAPIIILIIAGGAVILGGAILVNKKKQL